MPTQDPPVQDSTFENKLDELISAVTPNVPGFVSDAYDPTDTYAVGEYAIHENILYKCTTAISTPEAWNSTHWTPTNCANELSQLKSSLDGLIKFKTVSRDITQGAGSDYWSLTIPASITGYTKLITGVNIVYATGGGAGGSCYLRGYMANSDTQITAYVYNTSSSSQSLTLEANVLFIPTTHSL